eukprot:1619592-Lingulodinium_polyedra.AAC.1
MSSCQFGNRYLDMFEHLCERKGPPHPQAPVQAEVGSIGRFQSLGTGASSDASLGTECGKG